VKNEGTVDRVVRVALGVALLSLTVLGPKTPWGLVGIVPLATGLFGFCPLYRILGVNTCSTGK
jgi:Inner membrane protein YgaP-like, transmembrane domain